MRAAAVGVKMSQSTHDEIKKILRRKPLAYVLITCTDPDEAGEMDVQLSSQGDPALVSYLLEGALEKFDGCEESECSHS